MLGDQADQRDQADLAVDVHRAAGEIQRRQRAGQRERHRDHDHDRIDEALELRRQHQIDEAQRQQEDERDRGARLLELAALAGIVDLHGARQHALGRRLFQHGQRIAERIARRRARR